MSRIKIKDLPEDEKVSKKEMKTILGGSGQSGLIWSSGAITESNQSTTENEVSSFSFGVSQT